MPNKASIWIAALSLLITIGWTSKVMPSETGRVSGILSYPENISLPPNATAYIILTDVSPLQYSSSEIVARQIIHHLHQSSIPFELEYDSTEISEHHLYAIQARITSAGKVILTNSSAYPVITQGNPTVVEVYVEPADYSP